MLRTAVAALLLLTACSSQQPASRQASTTGNAPAQALLVVARADPAAIPAQPAVARGQPTSRATVSIVAVTGKVVASATFDLAPVPLLANAAPMLQPPVRVVAGSVFFADAHGVVRRLDRDGRVTGVATFPLNNTQQELSFAVRPDGKQLLASILSAPGVHDPPPRSLADPFFVAGGRWTLEWLTADAGGTAISTFRRDLGTAFPSPTIVVGWDRSGPLATLNTVLARQDAPITERFTGSQLIHVALDGSHLDQVGGPGCEPVDELPDGTVLCSVDRRLEVRDSSGEAEWAQDLGDAFYFTPRLSPDGERIAAAGTIFSRTTRPASGARLAASGTPDVFAEGWLDTSTVVASKSQLSVGRLGPGAPLVLVGVTGRETRTLGVTGIFEAAL